MKTEKIATLAVLLFVCSGFAAADNKVTRTLKAAREIPEHGYVKLEMPTTPTSMLEKMAGVKDGAYITEVQRLAEAARLLAEMESDLKYMPKSVAKQVNLPTPEELAVTISSSGPRTYRLDGDSPMTPLSAELQDAYLRSLEMPVRWNAEKGYLETTNGSGAIVPFHTLNPGEQQLRWAAQQGNTPFIDVKTMDVKLPVDGQSRTVDGIHFSIGEDCTAILERADYYFFNWKIQMWMYHHRNGKVTYQERFSKEVEENGELVFQNRIEDVDAFPGWLEGNYEFWIPNFKHERVSVFTHLPDGTIRYVKTIYPPEWMQEVLKQGKASVVALTD